MQFDDYLSQHHIAMQPAERFAGYATDVLLPPDWEPYGAAPGIRVWLWRDDPRLAQFGANAVLNLYRVQAPEHPAALDLPALFATLCAQQRQSVPGNRELGRDLTEAPEGLGAAGTLILQIDHEVGTLDSATQTRIVPTDHGALIAQLTVTALHDSPVDWPHIVLTVAVDHAPDTVGFHGGEPTSAPQARL